MRLSQSYIDSIKSSLSKFSTEEINVYLYGSRTDDTLAGGDIDLIWIVSKDTVNNLNINKFKVLVAIESKIGEQKIDLSIITQEVAEKDPFYSMVLKQAIKL